MTNMPNYGVAVSKYFSEKDKGYNLVEKEWAKFDIDSFNEETKRLLNK